MRVIISIISITLPITPYLASLQVSCRCGGNDEVQQSINQSHVQIHRLTEYVGYEYQNYQGFSTHDVHSEDPIRYSWTSKCPVQTKKGIGY